MNNFNYIISIITKKKEILVILFFSISSSFLLHNSLKNNISNYESDEDLTIAMSFQSIFGEDYHSTRVGESIRNIGRLIYPFGIYYMNSNMGGEHINNLTWNMNGGFYLHENYKGMWHEKQYPDPNFQDFWFAMRFLLGVIVIISFYLATILIFKNNGLLPALFYLVISSYSSFTLSSLDVFYTESLMLIVINFIITIYYLKEADFWRFTFFCAFLIAFAINIKLTAVFLVFLVYYLFTFKVGKANKYSNEILCLLILFFFYLNTLFIKDYGSYLNHTLSNIYHFKTGHLNVQPDGWYQIKSIFKALGPLGILYFPMSLIFILSRKIDKKMIFVYIIIAINLLIVIQFSGVRFFLMRNLNTLFVLMVFSYSLYIANIKYFLNNKPFRVIAYSFISFYFIFNFYNKYDLISEKSFAKELVGLKKLGVVDFSLTHFENAQKVQPMEEAYNLTTHDKIIQSRFDSLDNVVVKRINNNKQYTNYMLPLKFDLIKRKGDLFYFKRKIN
jgi:hypothetical protein